MTFLHITWTIHVFFGPALYFTPIFYHRSAFTLLFRGLIHLYNYRKLSYYVLLCFVEHYLRYLP